MPLFGPPTVESMKKRNDVKGLLKEFGKTNTLEQLEAIQALGELRAVEAVNPLVTLLRIENNSFFPSVIGPEIVKALALIHDARALPTLIQGLYHPYTPNTNIRDEAEKAIPQFGKTAITPLFEAVQDRSLSPYYRGVVADMLVKVGGADTVDLWISLLSSDWLDTQEAAMRKLGELKNSRAVDPLIVLFKNPKATNRALAASILGDLGNSRAVDPLVEGLGDHNVDVQKKVILALIKLADARASEALLTLFLEGDKLIRYETTCAMKAFPDRRAIPKLLDWLKDSDEVTQCQAAIALTAIGDEQAVKPLLAAINNPSKNVRRAAANGLVNFYRSGKLASGLQDLVLKVKTNLEAKHSDYEEPHQDIPGCLDPHSDISPTHHDEGIGIEL